MRIEESKNTYRASFEIQTETMFLHVSSLCSKSNFTFSSHEIHLNSADLWFASDDQMAMSGWWISSAWEWASEWASCILKSSSDPLLALLSFSLLILLLWGWRWIINSNWSLVNIFSWSLVSLSGGDVWGRKREFWDLPKPTRYLLKLVYPLFRGFGSLQHVAWEFREREHSDAKHYKVSFSLFGGS